jgi:hypothetical protein
MAASGPRTTTRKPSWRTGLISVDVSDRLREFNELRKDVAYDEPGPELAQLDLEDVASNLENFVEEVSRMIEAAEADQRR